MRRALLVSPHLDDAVFSCGALAALLVMRGWDVVVATVFTRSVHPARGFALACQRDKGLPDEVDYMALRRAEDAAALHILGARAEWLDQPEAPHRGYDSAAELFGEYGTRDDPAAAAAAVARCVEEIRPDLLLAPAALGGHVDHRRVVDAILAVRQADAVAWWRDTPYSIRTPDAGADPRLAAGGTVAVPIGATLDHKIAAAACYCSQIGFQFGGADAMGAALRTLALREGGGVPAERLYATAAIAGLLE